jgi:hypothetical protein
MLFSIILTLGLIVLSILLTFLYIDIVAIAGIYLALMHGFLYGIILVISSKLISGFLRKKLDHRTLIHLIGIVLVISIGTLLPFSHIYYYPIILFLVYTAITFPVIQYMKGDLFKGILFSIKDIISALVFLWLLKLIF